MRIGGAPAVLLAAAKAGVIASSIGSAKAVPRPRKKKRRSRDFLVMIIWLGFSSAGMERYLLSPAPRRKSGIRRPRFGGGFRER